MIPSPLSLELGYMLLVAVMMIIRTYCDVWMISNSTSIERSIITRDFKSFKHFVLRFVSLMLPISVVNQLLKYSLDEMHLRFRTRLTNHMYKNYLKGYTYYRISNLDNRIANPDQLLTQDIDRFCRSVTDLYSNTSKPILDIFIYARTLSSSIGAQGPTTMLGYLVRLSFFLRPFLTFDILDCLTTNEKKSSLLPSHRLFCLVVTCTLTCLIPNPQALTGFFLTALRKPVLRYTVQEQQLEGHFRFVNSRLITNSEEIAFYNGNVKETTVLNGAFRRLVDHLRKSIQFRFRYKRERE